MRGMGMWLAYEIRDITDLIQTQNETKFVPYPQEQGGL